jgi:FlaA1/EpsC-like NDP-sugar epimerase
VVPLRYQTDCAWKTITITQPDIIHFMTIPRGLPTEFKSHGCGEIYIFDMGKPVKLSIWLKRHQAAWFYSGAKDIGIQIVGLRPGKNYTTNYRMILQKTMLTVPIVKSAIAEEIADDFDSLHEAINELNANASHSITAQSTKKNCSRV